MQPEVDFSKGMQTIERAIIEGVWKVGRGRAGRVRQFVAEQMMTVGHLVCERGDAVQVIGTPTYGGRT